MLDWLDVLFPWVRAHNGLVWGVGVTSAVLFLGTLIVVPLLLTGMPADYFLHDPKDRVDSWAGRHAATRISLRLLKNTLGAVFVVLGISMLVLPGQGILTILVGIALLDLPGKRKLEVALLRRNGVYRAVDWLRRKRHREPLVLPPMDEDVPLAIEAPCADSAGRDRESS